MVASNTCVALEQPFKTLSVVIVRDRVALAFSSAEIVQRALIAPASLVQLKKLVSRASISSPSARGPRTITVPTALFVRKEQSFLSTVVVAGKIVSANTPPPPPLPPR